jgi:hypothetical protein
VNLSSLSLYSLVLIPALLSCGKEEQTEASRSIPGVLLVSGAETGSGYLPDSELRANGANLYGGWYTYDDVEDCPTADPARLGSINPTKGAPFPVTEYASVPGMTPPPGEEEDNKSAFRVYGGGHELWGAGVGIGLNNQGAGGPMAYDLTKTGGTGLRLWAKSTKGPLTLVKIKIQDKWSEEKAGLCCLWDKTACAMPNTCGFEGKQGCFDAPFVYKDIGTEWTLIEVPFAEFVREGWGQWTDHDQMIDHTMEPIALTEAYQLQIEVPAVAEFDLWIDNVGFTLPAGM